MYVHYCMCVISVLVFSPPPTQRCMSVWGNEEATLYLGRVLYFVYNPVFCVVCLLIMCTLVCTVSAVCCLQSCVLLLFTNVCTVCAGTQLDRRGSEPSPLRTTEEPW